MPLRKCRARRKFLLLTAPHSTQAPGIRRPRRTVRAGARARVGFIVRPATADDYNALDTLFRQGDVLHVRALPEVFRTLDGPARSREYLGSLLTSPDTTLLVADTGQQLLGVVHLTVRQPGTFPGLVARRYAVIENIVVLRSVRRQGIGTALMLEAWEWARAHEAGTIELNVWEFNKPALAFYSRLGYRTVSRRLRKTLT